MNTIKWKERNDFEMHPSKLRTYLPLIQVLKELKPYQRQLVVEHLDSEACQTLGFCLSTVLQKGSNLSNKNQIKCCVKANKVLIGKILKPPKSKKGQKAKQQALTLFGGSPLALILTTAIPMLLNLLK